MQNKSLSKRKTLSELKEISKIDQKYDDGKILCSMCTKPQDVAVKAYKMFLNANLGDPGLFPGAATLEREVVKSLSALLHGSTSTTGFIVSGGTEANLLALFAAKFSADISEPEIVLPESVHFSMNKICKLLSLKPVYADLDGSFRVDPQSVERCISSNTVAVVGSAGTSELGMIDPIDKLSALAQKHKVYLHVDASFGGFVIPFLARTEPFDFSLEGVQSITIDPHKMGMVPIPAGGILFRDNRELDTVKTETPYLTEDYQYTFVGTRTAAPIAATWSVFKVLGREGFKKTVDECMKTTRYLALGLRDIGLKLVVEPSLNIIAFRSADSKLLAEKIRSKGWFVSYIPRLNCIRLVVMPHVRMQHAKAFLKTLAELI